jgi:ABC-type nitrate/sulfonate/bicarbonate transport system permease component
MKILSDIKEIIITILFVFILWEVLTRSGIINTIFLPPPSKVFLAFPKNANEIFENFFITLKHISIGYFLGAVFGVLLGSISGWYRFLEKSVGNIVNALYPIPRITYLPLFILWFGYNETPIIVIIALSTFFPTFINTLSGVKKTDKRLIEVGKNFGANKVQILKKITFPSALPHITTGLRLGIGGSITSGIAAEMLIGLMGLGGVIYLAGEFFKPEIIILSQIVIAIFGLILYKIFDLIEYRYLLRWMPREK